MTNFKKVKENLEARGFAVSCFSTAAEANRYLDGQIDGKSVGVGGSMTVQDMGLPALLGTHNRIVSHWAGGTTAEAAGTQIYLSSVNGLAETGEIINIDGNGNRVSSGLFGHEKVYFIVGKNKLAPDYASALWRARNIAGPKNAQRLNAQTPCAAKGDKCYDCKSPGRICRALVVYWEKPLSMDFEVVLVDEDLGY